MQASLNNFSWSSPLFFNHNFYAQDYEIMHNPIENFLFDANPRIWINTWQSIKNIFLHIMKLAMNYIYIVWESEHAQSREFFKKNFKISSQENST